MATGPITEVLQQSSGTTRVDWNDVMNVIEAADTPFLASLKVGKKPVQVESNWPGMKRSIGVIAGVPDNTPETGANNQPRVSIRGVSQQVREPWKVSDFAQYTETYGVKDEIAFQKAEALIRLRIKLERLFLSTQDCAREGGGNPAAAANLTRGVGRWLQPLAASLNAQYPIPDGFRVAAACWYTGTLAALEADDVQAILLAASKQRKQDVTLDLQAGPSLMAKIADFTEHDPNATANNFPIKQYQITGRDLAFLKRVEFFTFPNGKLRAHENFNLFYDLTTGLPTYQTDAGGYLLDMANGWELALLQALMHEDLPKDGSGPRGFWKWIGMLKCYRPAGQGCIYPSATEGWTYTE